MKQAYYIVPFDVCYVTPVCNESYSMRLLSHHWRKTDTQLWSTVLYKIYHTLPKNLPFMHRLESRGGQLLARQFDLTHKAIHIQKCNNFFQQFKKITWKGRLTCSAMWSLNATHRWWTLRQCIKATVNKAQVESCFPREMDKWLFFVEVKGKPVFLTLLGHAHSDKKG